MKLVNVLEEKVSSSTAYKRRGAELRDLCYKAFGKECCATSGGYTWVYTEKSGDERYVGLPGAGGGASSGGAGRVNPEATGKWQVTGFLKGKNMQGVYFNTPQAAVEVIKQIVAELGGPVKRPSKVQAQLNDEENGRIAQQIAQQHRSKA